MGRSAWATTERSDQRGFNCDTCDLSTATECCSFVLYRDAKLQALTEGLDPRKLTLEELQKRSDAKALER